MLNISVFALLFIIVLIILAALAAAFLLWLAHIDSLRKRKKLKR